MNYQQAINLITSQDKFKINLGLDRMKALADIFNNPQDDLKIIHVAGTNGKGSVCAMLAKILEENGYKTGLYTSPHLKSYTERIKINFNDISENDFAKYTELIDETSKENNIGLTEFEILTMIAFLYFKDKTDIVLLETGMGGRLDATNIIKNPLLTVITSVNFDHLDRLGTTIEQIAGEKAGIIKRNVPVLISRNNAGYEVVKNKAKELNSEILSPEKDFELIDENKNIFSNGKVSYELALRGLNQGQNFALVHKACEYLNLNIKNALKNVVWNSRFQYLQDKNLLVDAAHNPDAIRLLKQNLNTYYKNKKKAFLFGVLNTKDYKKIIKTLFSNADEIYITDNFSHNCVDKEVLLNEIKVNFPDIKAETIDINNINEFINYDFEGIKICCGSFYLCSKIL